MGLRYKEIVTLRRTYVVSAIFWAVSPVSGLFFHLNYRIALVISIAWYTKIFHHGKDYFRAWISSIGQKIIHVITGGPSSRLEKKPTINSWTRHALCDSVLSYERNRWKFEHVIRNSMGNGILSIYNSKYFEIWIFYA